MCVCVCVCVRVHGCVGEYDCVLWLVCACMCVQVSVGLVHISVCVDILGSTSYKYRQCSSLHHIPCNFLRQLIYSDVYVVLF